MSAPVIEAVAVEATVCAAVLPEMVDAYGVESAGRLCDARRTVLGCGGCACASLSEIAQTDPVKRAALGQEIRDLFVTNGGAQ